MAVGRALGALLLLLVKAGAQQRTVTTGPVMAFLVVGVSAQTVKLDSLGPIVVGKDGALSRVANWNELTPTEQAAALRAVAARNKRRLDEAKARGRPMARQPFWRHWCTRVRQYFARRGAWVRQVFSWRGAWVRQVFARRGAWARQVFARRGAAPPRRLVHLDFAPEFVAPILAREKNATTRWLAAEPHLASVGRGSAVSATCVRCGRGPFAELAVHRVEEVRFSALSDSLAELEGFRGGADQLRATLLRFYPRITNEDSVSVFHYTLISGDEQSAIGVDVQPDCDERSHEWHDYALAPVQN
ncbi:hypothetical protein AB1Y20_019459 [Prymnesium parvum]|uniref:ASCH domain-containing protein n=1 Tax=Prymnesium parvum TaxID=97485 RepID=A0AB34JSF8_PRYPA